MKNCFSFLTFAQLVIFERVDYQELFHLYKEPSIIGRYICLRHIEPVLLRLQKQGKVSVVGKSVLAKPVYVYKNGSGATKIMMWSQMHGNESTTTKALFDFFNFLDSEQGKELKEKFTFYILPMLNPDGAEKWTRNNANDIDLNRDSQNLTQPESRLLRQCIEDFQPDFCYNLHDQRTIFGAEGTKNPATVSFLAPAYDKEKSVNQTRKKAMQLIVMMNRVLQKLIPGHISRFDDGFNINCIGDSVQNMGIPTVLIEAGHFPQDYQREQTRKYIFIALIAGLFGLHKECETDFELSQYYNISGNKKSFYDFIYKKVLLNYDNKEIITNFAVQFQEFLVENDILFEAYISEIGGLEGISGHFEYEAQGKEYTDSEGKKPVIGKKADFYLGNTAFKNGFPL
ncbi:MAG: M14 metallopeptidase family protein [Flavobacteriaceae bacterium]